MATGVDNTGLPRVVFECGACPSGFECDPSGHCRVHGDGCEFPLALTFDGFGRATSGLPADPSRAHDDAEGACARASNGRDFVFSFHVQSDKVLRAVLAGVSYRSRALYLRRGCDQPATEIGCSEVAAGPVILTARIESGDWYLWADGIEDAYGGGAPTLTLSAVDPALTLNEDCVTRATVVLPPLGPVSFSGTTSLARDDSRTKCGPSGAPDLAWTFTLETAATVTITATPADWRAVLTVQAGCEDGSSSAALGCGASAARGEAAKVVLKSLAPGSYSVWLDGATTQEAGDFLLEFNVAPAAEAPANDTCSGAIPLTLNGAAAIERSGDTRGARDDLQGACGGAGGADLVYSFRLLQPQRIVGSITADRSNPLFRPGLYLRKHCDDPLSEFWCGFGADRVNLQINELPAGEYFLVVDGTDDSGGEFKLSLQATYPFLGQGCAAARELVFDSSGSVRVHGDTRWASAENVGECIGASQAKDVTYAFTTRSAAAMRATATPVDASGLVPQLYLREDCQLSAGCVDGTPGAPTILEITRLPPGRWFLTVDGQGRTAGPYELSVVLGPVPSAIPNESCASAELLALDAVTGAVSVQRTTAGAADDSEGSCAGDSGSDAAFAFDVASPMAVRVTAAATTFRPAVYLASACVAGLPSGELACATASSGVGSVITRPLAVGRYYVVVDGSDRADGSFTLTVEKAAPLPDDCATSVELALSPGLPAVVTGNTAQAHDDAASSLCAANAYGADLVYHFETSATYHLTARLSWSEPVRCAQLYVRRACALPANPADEVVCEASSIFNPDRELFLSIPFLPPGRWYLWVDGETTDDEGPFQLEVSLAPPPSVPSNETCASAVPLDLAAGSAVASGDLRGARPDALGSCGGAGPDLVYQVTVPAGPPADLRARVSSPAPPRGFAPLLYLRGACARGAADPDLDCAFDSGAGSAAIHVPGIAPGSYYLFVDAKGAVGGAFDLFVGLEPGAPNPDTCASARDLVFDADGRSVIRGTTVGALDDICCNSPDVVYRLNTTGLGARDLLVSLGVDQVLRPALLLRTQCDSSGGTDVASAYGDIPGQPLPLTVRGLPEGVYYLWVETSVDGSRFTLDVRLAPPGAPPANDACSGAAALSFSSGHASASGTLTWAHDDALGSCATTGGPDVVYSLLLDTTSSLRAYVTTATNARLAPVLFLRRACSDPSAGVELACAPAPGVLDPSAALEINAMPAGLYYLWVDSEAASEGDFTLDVDVGPPVVGPTNENCATATDLGVLTAGSVTTVTGTTRGAHADTWLACGSPGAPDVAYQFTLAQQQKVTLWVTGASAGFQPAVALSDGCDVGDTIDCRSAEGAFGSAGVLQARAPAGTRVVWVGAGDGFARPSAGAFTLRIELGAVTAGPPNDRCAGAVMLARGVPALGELVAASDDYSGPLSSLCGATPVSSRDVVYGFSPTAEGEFEIVATGGTAFWVTDGSCGDGAACMARGWPNPRGQASTSFRGEAGHVYWIVVENLSSAGLFILEVR